MPIITFGLNHKTAQLDLRERLRFGEAQLEESLADLLSLPAVNEAALLSTCNRTEIYMLAESKPALSDWLSRQHMMDARTLSTYCYYYQDLQAVKHMMRVACGLDSMVLGEPQILGQMKQAYTQSCDLGAIKGELHGLFQAVFATSKKVRTETGIGSNPITLAYAITQLAQRIYSDLGQCRVLFVGAGETIELAATHLDSQGVQEMTFASRTLTRAGRLADRFDGKQTHAIHIGDVPSVLHAYDIVVSATASQLPILNKHMLASALRARKHKPMLLVDLAVPRDIDPSVETLEDAYLYNIDQLQTVIAQNMRTRKQSAVRAEEIVDMKARHFMQQQRVQSAAGVIKAFREGAVAEKAALMTQALKQLSQGEDPHAVLDAFATKLTNRLLHKPTGQLRALAMDDEMSAAALIRAWFETE